MTTHAEDVLYSLLSDVDALEVLAREGLDPECIPTEEMRPVVEWCIEQFFKSGRKIAPSNDAILAMWKDVIEDAQVSLGDGTEGDSIEFAIDSLKSQFTHFQFQQFQRESAAEMSKAAPPDRVATVHVQADRLFALALRLQPRDAQTTGAEGFAKALDLYDGRVESGHTTMGLTFGTGMEAIDNHCFGIHAGELGVLAAGPKVGKSFFAAIVFLREWMRGRRAVLYTLENSVEMTMDRMVCAALGVDYSLWQRGYAAPEDRNRVAEFVHDVIPTFPGELHVLKPEPGKRSIRALVRQAQMLGAQSLGIDQLTFVEPDDERLARPLQIRQMTHDLKSMISSGRDQMSCLLMHQINREGVKAAEKIGRLEMYHLAEGSEAERTADWVFGLYQSDEQFQVSLAQFQILAARREVKKSWSLAWQPNVGIISSLGEIDL